MVSLRNKTTYQSSNFRKDRDLYKRVVVVCSQLKQHGVHSANRMKTAGFQYTGEGDAARCNSCQLEVSEWTREMDPFCIHLERSPNCSFVRSVQSKDSWTLNDEENPVKRQKLEANTGPCNQQGQLIELAILKQVRQRTFSHWPHRITPTKEQMINAGFLHCNIGDRVICIYCNLICQQWKGDTDDPVEVHKILSPKCPYVVSILTQNQGASVFILNGISTDHVSNQATLLSHVSRLHSDQIVYTSPCHVNYTSVVDRQATFQSWANDSPPSVDNLVKAGFFYTGTKNITTCFYCNGSLQNWCKNDDPLIEHIRWFPHCAYAKQLAGDDLHTKVQDNKRFRPAYETSLVSTNTAHNPSTDVRSQQVQPIDERTLSRLVAARLDLPISQRLLDRPFKLSIIKRCWENQLQMKHDDFVSDCDLYIACVILQRQIDHINGNKDNVIIPSIKMKSIRDKELSNTLVPQEISSSSSVLPSIDSLNKPVEKVGDPSVRTATSDVPMSVITTNEQSTADEVISDNKVVINNPCVMCWKEEKRLACIPCGHLAACVGCSQTLRTCPICRRSIEAFVRIYI